MKFPSAIVISLKRAQSRRNQFIPTLEDSGLNWEILDAIDGLELRSTPPEYHEEKVTRLLGFPLSASEIGCFLSHRLAWAKCVEKNELTLILEDDFSFAPHFQDALQAVIHEYDDWDLVRLQGLVETAKSTLIEKNQFQIVKNLEDPLGATAYLIRPDAAHRLLKSSQDIYEPLDHFLEHSQKHQLKIIAIKPYPVIASAIHSTILDRPDRRPIQGFRKLLRSFYRAWDRVTNPHPWFPKD